MDTDDYLARRADLQRLLVLFHQDDRGFADSHGIATLLEWGCARGGRGAEYHGNLKPFIIELEEHDTFQGRLHKSFSEISDEEAIGLFNRRMGVFAGLYHDLRDLIAPTEEAVTNLEMFDNSVRSAAAEIIRCAQIAEHRAEFAGQIRQSLDGEDTYYDWSELRFERKSPEWLSLFEAVEDLTLAIRKFIFLGEAPKAVDFDELVDAVYVQMPTPRCRC